MGRRISHDAMRRLFRPPNTVAIETPAEFRCVEFYERDVCPVCDEAGMLTWQRHEAFEGSTALLDECVNPDCGAVFNWNTDHPEIELAPE
jgi:hypothetical protein